MRTNFLTIRRRPFPEALVLWGLTTLLLFGWIPELFSPSSMNAVFEAFFLSVSLSLLWRGGLLSRNFLQLSIWPLAYAAVGFVLAVLIRKVNFYDFALAYKFIWYLVLLIPFSSVKLLDAQALERLKRLALFMFVLIYSAKYLSGEFRPRFFTENNFELLLVCLLFYASHIANGKTRVFDLLLLLAIALISGSRSGAALAAVTSAFCFDFKRINRPSTLLMLLAACAGVLGAFYVFNQRTTGGIESIDRVRFFQYFLESTSDWGWWQYLTGAPKITPLPEYVCERLSFYNSLFSFSEDGSCYSVILHSFNIRIILDHGIIIAVALVIFMLKILKNRTLKEKIYVFSILFLNGLSVSSLNNVYAALGVALVASGASAFIPNRHYSTARPPAPSSSTTIN